MVEKYHDFDSARRNDVPSPSYHHHHTVSNSLCCQRGICKAQCAQMNILDFCASGLRSFKIKMVMITTHTTRTPRARQKEEKKDHTNQYLLALRFGHLLYLCICI